MLWGGLSPTPEYAPPPITRNYFAYGSQRIPFTGPTAEDILSRISRDDTDDEAQELSIEREKQNIEILSHEQSLDAETLRILSDLQQKMMAEHNPTEHKRLSKLLESELFEVDSRLNDRLFGWLPDTCHKMTAGSFGLMCRFFLILCLIAIYGIGFALIILLNQRISMCDQGYVKGNEITNISQIEKNKCSGLADECELSGRLITFRTYINYRITAFVFLLLPFLYMPYMSILEITHTAKKVWDEFKITPSRPPKFKPTVTYLSRSKTFEKQPKMMYAMKRASEKFSSMSSVGHETALLILFLVFHVIFGCFSIALDYLVMKIDTDKASKCDILETGLNKFNNGIYLELYKVGTYNFSMGIVTLTLTLSYMCLQCTHTLYKDTRRKEYAKLDRDDKQKEADKEREKLKRELEKNIRDKRSLADHNKELERMRQETEIEAARSNGYIEGSNKPDNGYSGRRPEYRSHTYYPD
jgi:hypothetical protein